MTTVACDVNPSPHPFCMLLAGSSGSQSVPLSLQQRPAWANAMCPASSDMLRPAMAGCVLAFMNASAACVCMQLAQPEVLNLLVCRPLHTMLCPAMLGTYRLAWLT